MHPEYPCQFCGKRSPKSLFYKKKLICIEHDREIKAGIKERERRKNGGLVEGHIDPLYNQEEALRLKTEEDKVISDYRERLESYKQG